MEKIVAKKFFPESTIGLIDGNGRDLVDRATGVWVEVRSSDGQIISAEVYDQECEFYADIGLTIEDGELVDYDGVCSLPRELAEILKELGVKVPAMMMG
jgi:hypothetical protein